MSDNNDIYSDSSSESADSVEIESGELEDSSEFVEHEILPHHQAGYIYEGQSTGLSVFEIQRNLQTILGHPFSPWSNEDEFWLTHFIFIKAKMTVSSSNELLNSFKSGRINMHNDLSCSSYKRMMELIDQAKFSTVSDR